MLELERQKARRLVESQYLKSIIANRDSFYEMLGIASLAHFFLLTALVLFFSIFTNTQRHRGTGGEASTGDAMGKPGMEAHISTHIPRGG